MYSLLTWRRGYLCDWGGGKIRFIGVGGEAYERGLFLHFDILHNVVHGGILMRLGHGGRVESGRLVSELMRRKGLGMVRLLEGEGIDILEMMMAC